MRECRCRIIPSILPERSALSHPNPDTTTPHAAEPTAKMLRKKRENQVMPPEGFYVLGMEGPLMDGELERVKEWARQIPDRT